MNHRATLGHDQNKVTRALKVLHSLHAKRRPLSGTNRTAIRSYRCTSSATSKRRDAVGTRSRDGCVATGTDVRD